MTKKLRQKIKCLGEIKENFSTVGTPPPFSAGGVRSGLNLQPNLQKGGEGGAWQDLNF